MKRMVNDQMEGDNGICTVDVTELLQIVAGNSVDGVVPLVEFTGGCRKFFILCVEYGEMQGIHLRTTVLIQMGEGIDSRVVVCGVVPNKAVIGGHYGVGGLWHVDG